MFDRAIDMIPDNVRKFVDRQGVKELRPSQEKSIKKGLFKNSRNMLFVFTVQALEAGYLTNSLPG